MIRTWLDAFPAVPTLGLKLAPRFVTSERLLDPLGPLIKLVYDRNSGKKVEYEAKSHWGLEMKGADGFTYGIHHDNTTIGFDYASGATASVDDDGYPRMQLPAPRTYMDLVRAVMEDMGRLLDLAGQTMVVTRFGLVATTPLKAGGRPPGVERFLVNLANAPNSGTPITSSCQIYASLGRMENSPEGQAADDRCHYNVAVKSEDAHNPEAATTTQLSLDFQRYFTPGIKMDSAGARREIEGFVEAAMTHFQKFGSGL